MPVGAVVPCCRNSGLTPDALADEMQFSQAKGMWTLGIAEDPPHAVLWDGGVGNAASSQAPPDGSGGQIGPLCSQE